MKIFFFVFGMIFMTTGYSVVCKAENMTLNKCQKHMKIASQRAEECLKALETTPNPSSCQDSYLVVMTEEQVDSCNRVYILANNRGYSNLGEREKDDLLKYKVYKDNFLSKVKIIMQIRR